MYNCWNCNKRLDSKKVTKTHKRSFGTKVNIAKCKYCGKIVFHNGRYIAKNNGL